MKFKTAYIGKGCELKGINIYRSIQPAYFIVLDYRRSPNLKSWIVIVGVTNNEELRLVMRSRKIKRVFNLGVINKIPKNTEV